MQTELCTARHKMMQPQCTKERRLTQNRRQRSLFLSPWYWGSRGRRRGARRAADRARTHTDRYSDWLFALVLGLFLLSQADSLLTLMLLGSGGFFEANPLMSVLLAESPLLFVAVRAAIWGIMLAMLVVVSGWTLFGRVGVMRVLVGLFVVYLLHVASASALLVLLT